MPGRAEAFKEKSRESFGRKAANFEHTYDGKFCNDMYASVMSRLRAVPFARLLDVGCGTGMILSMAAAEFPKARLSGIDLSEDMIARAEALLGGRAELKTGDAETLPWEAGTFDAVVCNASFHHYPNPESVLSEMRRVLRDGGRLTIADPWWPNPRRFFTNLYLKLNRSGDVKIYSRNEVKRMLSHCGFSGVEWERQGKRFYIASATVCK